MKKKTNQQIQSFLQFIIFLVFVVGAYFTFRGSTHKSDLKNSNISGKFSTLKKYLLTFQKPQRIEILNYSKRFEKDIDEIKKMKVPQDSNANFYVSIQFFTDESDEKAPLIAQVRFIDVKTSNTLKEESLNLD